MRCYFFSLFFFFLLFFCEFRLGFSEGESFDGFAILGFVGLFGEAAFGLSFVFVVHRYFASLAVVSIHALFAAFDDVFLSFSGRFDLLQGLFNCNVIHSAV